MHRVTGFVGIVCLAVSLCSCGGASSSNGNGNGGNALPPDFTISATPTSSTVPPGGVLQAQIIVTAQNGFSGSITINITGLPNASATTPNTPFAMSPGTQNLTIAIPASASQGNSTVTVQGSSGNLQHSSTIALQVQNQQLASFSVFLNDSELSFSEGGSANTIVGLSLTSGGNSNFQVQFSVAGLPAGVQASFGANPFDASQPATSLTFNAASASSLANYQTVVVTATRSIDGFQASAQLQINVTPPVGTLPPIRTDFVRTDGTPAAAVYDAVRNLIYASNPQWNRVDVISAATHQIVNSVPAGSPTGMDMSLDGKHLIVGSSLRVITSIDISSLQVVNRTSVPPPQRASSSSIPALIANTSNGDVLLGMTNNSAPPSYSLVEWHPGNNTFTPLSPPGIGPWINALVRTGDGQKALVVDYGSDVNLAVYDAPSKTFPVNGQSPVGQVLGVAASPIAHIFVIVGTNGTVFVDPSLNKLASIPVGGYFYGMVYSPDGSKLYVATELASSQCGPNYPILETWDTTSYKLLGVAPAFEEPTGSPPCVPPYYFEGTPLAADNSGLVFSTSNQANTFFTEGLVIDDAANFQNLLSLPVGPPYPQLSWVDEAPLNAPLATGLGQIAFDVLPDVWFGNTRGTNIQYNATLVSVTAPPSSTSGLVNVKAVLPDGWFSIALQSFSYGSKILWLGGNAGAEQGGASLALIGYGLLGSNGEPSVTIGGAAAQITAKSKYVNFNDSGFNGTYPFAAMDEVMVVTPPGVSGHADVTISSQAGTATIPNGFTYLPITDYASSDQFTFVLYDPGRHWVYLSAGDHIDVFSADTGQFLAPIVPPSLSGARKILGLALTPDGSKLLAANFADISVAIIDPDSPSSSTAVHIPVNVANSPGIASVVATSTDKVFVDGVSGTFSGCGGQLYELDLLSRKAILRSDVPFPGMQVGGNQFSRDTAGDLVVFDGSSCASFLWNAATDKFTLGVAGDSLAASGDGRWFATDYTRLDAQMVSHMQTQVPEFFSALLTFPDLPGEKMNASGSLLYTPVPTGFATVESNGVSVSDTNTGSWIGQILLAEQLAPSTQCVMDYDEAGNRLFLITDKGLTVVELPSPPVSIGYLNPETGTASGGTAVTIRGNSFQAGTTVSFGGSPASTNFVDENTLQVVTPPGAPGGTRVVIKNPDGTSYSLDAAFTYQ